MPIISDITNQKFNKLIAINPLLERTLTRRIQWLLNETINNNLFQQQVVVILLHWKVFY